MFMSYINDKTQFLNLSDVHLKRISLSALLSPQKKQRDPCK